MPKTGRKLLYFGEMLYACSRCTQMLPSDAVFCRRCGATVQFTRHEKSTLTKNHRSILTPVLVTLLLMGISLAAFVGFTVHMQAPAAPPIIAQPKPYYSYNSPPVTYSPPANLQLPLYAPNSRVQTFPAQPPFRYHEISAPHRR